MPQFLAGLQSDTGTYSRRQSDVEVWWCRQDSNLHLPFLTIGGSVQRDAEVLEGVTGKRDTLAVSLSYHTKWWRRPDSNRSPVVYALRASTCLFLVKRSAADGKGTVYGSLKASSFLQPAAFGLLEEHPSG